MNTCRNDVMDKRMGGKLSDYGRFLMNDVSLAILCALHTIAVKVPISEYFSSSLLSFGILIWSIWMEQSSSLCSFSFLFGIWPLKKAEYFFKGGCNEGWHRPITLYTSYAVGKQVDVKGGILFLAFKKLTVFLSFLDFSAAQSFRNYERNAPEHFTDHTIRAISEMFRRNVFVIPERLCCRW